MFYLKWINSKNNITKTKIYSKIYFILLFYKLRELDDILSLRNSYDLFWLIDRVQRQYEVSKVIKNKEIGKSWKHEIVARFALSWHDFIGREAMFLSYWNRATILKKDLEGL